MKTVEVSVDSGHERVVLCDDPETGYRGIIAVHSTRLGPAVGGTRVWPYGSVEEALADALRLSRGMTYKAAAAGLALGGGKAVIIADSRTIDREKIFRAHGRFVEMLGGKYITAEDVGTSPADMAIVRKETEFVAGLADRSGDPSPSTAHGVVRAMQAAARERWGSDDLVGRTVSLQGCGHVGTHVAHELHELRARLILSDIDYERAAALARDIGARTADPDAIYEVAADIFAPCALGAIIDDGTIARMSATVVAGAANNQLREDRHGDMLAGRGIVYAPDYIANAGGIINGCRELLGWTVERAARAVDAIYETTAQVLEIARMEEIGAHTAADRLAESRLSAEPTE
ncbi:MAG: leucine dehydrogenase [Gemmatimonadota bacterium]|nr:leucine dehydrogenase [Gemmatimonadota bacterium]